MRAFIQKTTVKRLFLLLLPLASAVLGLFAANSIASVKSGYLAGYVWFTWMLLLIPWVLLCLFVGAILSLFRIYRVLGVVVLVSAAATVFGYFGAFETLRRLGKVEYEHERMVSFGPNEKSDLVVYFKPHATDEQIYHFATRVVSTPDSDGRGYYHLEGISLTYATSLSVDGCDYKGYAIGFSPDATVEQRDRVKAAVKSSLIVYKVLQDVAPRDVKKLD
jgi:hypothetical protein